ncbi:MAG: DUF5777 family beta-barrel protein [Bacteroidales bacterium]
MIKLFKLFALFIIGSGLHAQDLDSLLNEKVSETSEFTDASFKSTRIINGHSVMQLHKQHLDFRISHRFGVVNNGISDLFGLDHGSIRFTLEYGINDWLTVGFGRSSFQATYDGSLKFRILRQSTGKKNMPVTLSYFAGMDIFTSPFPDPERNNSNYHRLSYVHQLLIARKFNESLSVQLSPTLVHRNLVPTVYDMNDLFAMGFGGRFKVSKRMAITAEYFYTLRSPRSSTRYYDPLSVGVDIETGGHVFQIMFTNSSLMYDSGFISGEHNDNFFNGGIHLGFNISRMFSFQKE